MSTVAARCNLAGSAESSRPHSKPLSRLCFHRMKFYERVTNKALLSSATERLEVARLVRAIPRQRVWPLRPLSARSAVSAAVLTDRSCAWMRRGERTFQWGLGLCGGAGGGGGGALALSFSNLRNTPTFQLWMQRTDAQQRLRAVDGLDLLLGDRHAVLVQLRALLVLARRVGEGQPNQPLRQLQRQVRPAGKPPARGS